MRTHAQTHMHACTCAHTHTRTHTHAHTRTHTFSKTLGTLSSLPDTTNIISHSNTFLFKSISTYVHLINYICLSNIDSLNTVNQQQDVSINSWLYIIYSFLQLVTTLHTSNYVSKTLPLKSQLIWLIEEQVKITKTTLIIDTHIVSACPHWHTNWIVLTLYITLQPWQFIKNKIPPHNGYKYKYCYILNI